MPHNNQRCTFNLGSVQPSNRGGRQYACTMLQAGSLEGHGLTISQEALQASLPVFQNLTAFLDHTGFFERRKLDKLLGVFSNVYFNELFASVDATLELWDTPSADWLAPILDQLVAAQDDDDPAADIGLSADCWIQIGEPETDSNDTPITRILSVDSVDVVFRPASDGARFKRILAQAGPLAVRNEPPTPVLRRTQEVTVTEEKKVELVASPAEPQAEYSRPTEPDNRTEQLDATLHAANQFLIDAQLQASSLPEPNQANITRRVAQMDLTPAQVAGEIEEERTMLAALAQTDVIQGFGTPLDESMLTVPMDVAKNAVHWMMGVPGCDTPPPDLRMPSNIYFALTGDFDWHGIHRPDRAKFARASTSTLADLATDAMNIILVEQWEALRGYRWFEPLVTVAPHDGSLNDMNWVGFGGVANLPSVSEGQTYSEINVADSKETDSFTKYGGYVGITEEMFRKNQMLKIQGIPRALAASAIRTRSYYISYIFSQASGTGPTLDEDSVVLFDDSDHSNYATTAFSVSAWATARQELYEQTQLGSSKPLAIWPKFLLVPVELYDTALITFGYGQGPGGYPSTADNDVNPYAMARPGDPRPEIVVVPEWTDSNNWYYLADPAIQPVLFMSYAQNQGGRGHPMPELFTVSSPTAGLIFTNDVLPIKVRDWFAYGVAGYRGVGGRIVT